MTPLSCGRFIQALKSLPIRGFESWTNIKVLPTLPENADKGTQLSHRFRQLISTEGALQKCMAFRVVITPHSMQAERMVSVHNKCLTVYRSNMEQSTVNSRMQIVLKVAGIASFDPRGEGADFLKSRQRRFRQSNFESYQDRKLVNIKI